jgi:hypothetical protein
MHAVSRFNLRLALPVLLLLTASALQARAQDILWDQPPTINFGFSVADFTDAPDLNTYGFSPFTVGDGGWLIDAVGAYGFWNTDSPTAPTDTLLAFSSTKDVSGISTVYTGGTADLTDGLLIYDFSVPVYLAPGTYWISAWNKQPFDPNYGDVFYWFMTDVIGSEAYYQNPGGGEGYGTDSTPVSSHYGPDSAPVADFAFTIIGTAVPEPGGAAALLAGLLTAGTVLLRRRR